MSESKFVAYVGEYETGVEMKYQNLLKSIIDAVNRNHVVIVRESDDSYIIEFSDHVVPTITEEGILMLRTEPPHLYKLIEVPREVGEKLVEDLLSKRLVVLSYPGFYVVAKDRNTFASRVIEWMEKDIEALRKNIEHYIDAIIDALESVKKLVPHMREEDKLAEMLLKIDAVVDELNKAKTSIEDEIADVKGLGRLIRELSSPV